MPLTGRLKADARRLRAVVDEIGLVTLCSCTAAMKAVQVTLQLLSLTGYLILIWADSSSCSVPNRADLPRSLVPGA